jgi:hypothetical protein
MLFLEILEILVCILAVYGLYAILCRMIGHGCYHGDLSVAVHYTAGEERDAVLRAVILTEAQNGPMHAPVLLLEAQPTAEEMTALHECGCHLYSRIL